MSHEDRDDFDLLGASDIPWATLSIASALSIGASMISLLMGALEVVDRFTFGIMLFGATFILLIASVFVYYSAPLTTEYRRKSRSQVREARSLFITMSKVMAGLAGLSILGAIATIWVAGQGGKDLTLANLDPSVDPSNTKLDQSNTKIDMPAIAMGNAKDGKNTILRRHLDPAQDHDDKKAKGAIKSAGQSDGESGDEKSDPDTESDSDKGRFSSSSPAKRRLSRGEFYARKRLAPELVAEADRVNPPSPKRVDLLAVACCISPSGYFAVEKRMVENARALKLIYNRKEFPAYVVEDVDDPELALVATDYAPYLAFGLGDRGLQDHQAIDISSGKVPFEKLTIKRFDAGWWIFNGEDSDDLRQAFGGERSVARRQQANRCGAVTNERQQFIGMCVKSKEIKTFEMEKKSPTIELVQIGGPGRRTIGGESYTVKYTSVARLLDNGYLRSMLGRMRLPMEGNQQADHRQATVQLVIEQDK